MSVFKKTEGLLERVLIWVSAYGVLAAGFSWIARNLTVFGEIGWAEAVVGGFLLASLAIFVLSVGLVAWRTFHFPKPTPTIDEQTESSLAVSTPTQNAFLAKRLNDLFTRMNELTHQFEGATKNLVESKLEALHDLECIKRSYIHIDDLVRQLLDINIGSVDRIFAYNNLKRHIKYWHQISKKYTPDLLAEFYNVEPDDLNAGRKAAKSILERHPSFENRHLYLFTLYSRLNTSKDTVNANIASRIYGSTALLEPPD